MRILFCCEQYAPSTGGVQKVMQEIAEHLVLRGHEVAVATSRHPERSFSQLNGVRIQEFEIAGNLVCGLRGQVQDYQSFVVGGGFDALLVKAAQQWSFDALWDVLPQITARKVHIPCGYSSLLDPAYAAYYRQMPNILRRFDHLIYYAGQYRDIDFARQHGITHYSIIPNGASEDEFAAAPAVDIRGKLAIPADEFIFLTVGNPPQSKGQIEVAQAYEKLRLPFASTLLLNGSYAADMNPQQWASAKRWLNRLRTMKRRLLFRPAHPAGAFAELLQAISGQPGKRVIIADLARPDLLAAFFASGLFVFASHVEYSPLVLFEAAGAGLPFLSVPVGNATEIAAWTGGGEICPAGQDSLGNIKADPAILAEKMSRLAQDSTRLLQLKETGRKRWSERFTWAQIAMQYEQALKGAEAKNV
jgi:glycosyltransferase involved in cell wall biosynthesis